MEILEFAVGSALVWAVAILAFLAIIAGLGWHELRSGLVHYAYKSFTHDGIVIAGARPHRGARVVIRLFAPKDDERRQLVLDALAPTETAEAPRPEPLPRMRTANPS